MARHGLLPRLYRRLFCPNGIVFGDAREYVCGDDTRLIDWNVTAKMNALFVDAIDQDSGSDVIFAIDCSESMKFGTRRQTKLALAAEILQKFGGLAERCGDRIGLVLFSDRIEKFFPPRRSAKVFQCAIAGTALSNRKKGTDAANAMNFLRRVIKKRSVVIFLTDIFALASGRKAMMSKLHQLGTRHNTFIVAISDGGDMLRSGIGRVMVEDGESGEMLEIDGDDGQLMEKIHGKCSAYFDLIFMDIGKIGVGALEVNTAYNCDDFLFAFLNKCRTMGGAGTGRWTMKKHGRR